MKSVVRFACLLALCAAALVPYAYAAEQKSAGAAKAEAPKAAPIDPYNVGLLRNLEETVWANRDKLERWCLKCMRFEGWQKRVEYLRSRLADNRITTDIFKARGELLDEIQENMLDAYIVGIEARSTEIVTFKRSETNPLPGGDVAIEFKITERDELGNVDRIHYEVRTVRYEPRAKDWRQVSLVKHERSALQMEEDGIRRGIRRK
jgi:hypothetical protein